MFLRSHPISRRHYVFVVHLLPGWSFLTHVFRLFRRFRRLLVSRFLPGSLHCRHHHRHRRYRYLPAICFEQFFSWPFRISRRISSHRPYFAPSPRRQFQFFGLISPDVLNAGSFLSVNSLSGVRFYSAFGSAYRSLLFILEFFFNDFFL